MTTEHVTQTTEGNIATSSLSADYESYFESAVIAIGVVGTATNSLILYALLASKQHKKHALIVNQNAFDLFSSFFLIITYSLKLCDLYLTGALGYWLCITLLSENLVWMGTNGSIINLAIITIDRYLKVVHPIWSKKNMRPWMIYSAMTFAWFAGVVYNGLIVYISSGVIEGVCYGYQFFESVASKTAYYLWYVTSFYFIILVIFIFCYWRILIAIRRQASVMAGHSRTGVNAAQVQSTQLQANVIKTMIFVCAFFAIAWFPCIVYHVMVAVDAEGTLVDSRYYASMFIAFLYTSTNPFIYATKFKPVNQILRGMIACKKISRQHISDPENERSHGENVKLHVYTIASYAGADQQSNRNERGMPTASV